ncbi:ribonuclease P protein component [Methylobacterium sp. R2-1]|uniref:ribonuclease P protein component n=1 Tax=Methylobacterium sp. R2-1 TaxID=2587064 RepID=UPI0016115825|nr:ribonuclease P protein component [Methylobacterium sp. R2-1]MBB2963563.1 ribonuclease P protein component [Methylobacterium sp. R2-1]
MPTIGRLRRRPDFLAAAQGRRFHTERMSAQGRLRAPDETRDGASAEGLFLGFTITKRVGHATERNRIRRRLRSAVAAVAADAPSIGADVVVIARRPALDAPFESLVEDLRRALHSVTRPAAPRSGDAARAPSSKPPSSQSRRGGSRSGRGAAAGGTPPFPSTSKAPDGSTDG